MSSGFARGLVIFLMFMMTIAVNIEDNVIARLGFDNNYLLLTLISVVFAALLVHRKLMLVVLVLFLSLAANAPADFLLNFGIDRDYITGALVAIIIVPLIARFLD